MDRIEFRITSEEEKILRELYQHYLNGRQGSDKVYEFDEWVGIQINNELYKKTTHKKNPSPTGNILAEAQAVIYGDREKTYGAPDKNLQVIADLWGAYRGTEYTVDDVCCMMVLLKLARLKNQPNHRDSQVDACGYIALMERVQEYRKNQNQPQQGKN